jgi:hypothetical protein
LITYTSSVKAQRDYKYKFISRVIDDSTGIAIKDCHIINKTQHMGTISNEFGSFTITANLKDSIQFTAIGYEKLVIVATDSMYTNNRIVRLKPKIYDINVVDIGLFSTYDRFKQDVMGLELKKPSLLEIDPINKFEVYTPPLPGQGGINVPFTISPITYFYNLWSKEGKNQRRYQSIINKTAEHIIIAEKFNGDIVGQLTGLKDDELIAFMSYCFFTKEYLLYASQGEINREIMKKYKQYMEEKDEK